jgi:hypothetical protein
LNELETAEYKLFDELDQRYRDLVVQDSTSPDEVCRADLLHRKFNELRIERSQIDLCSAAKRLGPVATCEALASKLEFLIATDPRQFLLLQSRAKYSKQIKLFLTLTERAKIREALIARASSVIEWLARKEELYDDYIRLPIDDLCDACKHFSKISRLALCEELGLENTMTLVMLDEYPRTFEHARSRIRQLVPRYRFIGSLSSSEKALLAYQSQKSATTREARPETVPEDWMKDYTTYSYAKLSKKLHGTISKSTLHEKWASKEYNGKRICRKEYEQLWWLNAWVNAMMPKD